MKTSNPLTAVFALPTQKVKSLLLVAAVVAAPMALNAQLIQMQNFSFTPNGSVELTFNKVDLAVEDVTQIIVTLELTKSGGYLAVDNDSTETGLVTFTHTLDGALSSSDVSLIDGGGFTNWANLDAVSSTKQTLQGTTTDDTESFDVTNDVDYYRFDSPTQTVSTGTTLNSSIYGQFLSETPDTYTIVFNANQLVAADGLSGLQQSFTVSQASGFVTVEVVPVEVVPEPSSFAAIFGVAVLGFVAVRRRR